MALAFAAPGAQGQEQQPLHASDVADGMRLFQQKGNCQACHGWSGDGHKTDSQMPDGANLRDTKLNSSGPRIGKLSRVACEAKAKLVHSIRRKRLVVRNHEAVVLGIDHTGSLLYRLDPQTRHGCVRIQARYFGFRAGFMSPEPHRPTSVRSGANKRNADGCRASTDDWEDVRLPA